MRKLWIFAGLLFLAGGASFAAGGDLNSPGSFGVGVALGQPMGVTGKLWLSHIAAADGFLGYHINHNFDMHADYLLHTYVLSGQSNGAIPLYAGLGARVLAGDDTQFGVRIPL